MGVAFRSEDTEQSQGAVAPGALPLLSLSSLSYGLVYILQGNHVAPPPPHSTPQPLPLKVSGN